MAMNFRHFAQCQQAEDSWTDAGSDHTGLLSPLTPLSLGMLTPSPPLWLPSPTEPESSPSPTSPTSPSLAATTLPLPGAEELTCIMLVDLLVDELLTEAKESGEDDK
jgi:hypothetical protein